MGVKVIKGINDLKSQNPILIKEWHPTKNGFLTPEMIHYGSSTKVWWVCSKGHEYLMSVDKRNKRHQGCPYCSNHKVNEENCVEKNYPELVSE